MHIVITGGHTGIGLELTKRLVAEGQHQVGVVVRSEARLADVPAEVRKALTVWEADLAVQSDVARVASEITSHWPCVDGLFNNAGVLLGELRKSPQGNEMHFEVNTLAPYQLTTKLHGALTAAAAPFVVNTVTGSMHRTALDVQELIEPTSFQRLFGAYLQSKLALVLLMNDLAAQPEWQPIRIRNVNPGANKTSMTAGEGMPGWLRPLRGLLFSGPKKGGNLLYDAAFRSDLIDQTGIWLDEKKIRPVPRTLSADDRARLLDRLA